MILLRKEALKKRDAVWRIALTGLLLLGQAAFCIPFSFADAQVAALNDSGNVTVPVQPYEGSVADSRTDSSAGTPGDSFFEEGPLSREEPALARQAVNDVSKDPIPRLTGETKRALTHDGKYLVIFVVYAIWTRQGIIEDYHAAVIEVETGKFEGKGSYKITRGRGLKYHKSNVLSYDPARKQLTAEGISSPLVIQASQPVVPNPNLSYKIESKDDREILKITNTYNRFEFSYDYPKNSIEEVSIGNGFVAVDLKNDTVEIIVNSFSSRRNQGKRVVLEGGAIKGLNSVGFNGLIEVKLATNDPLLTKVYVVDDKAQIVTQYEVREKATAILTCPSGSQSCSRFLREMQTPSGETLRIYRNDQRSNISLMIHNPKTGQLYVRSAQNISTYPPIFLGPDGKTLIVGSPLNNVYVMDLTATGTSRVVLMPSRDGQTDVSDSSLVGAAFVDRQQVEVTLKDGRRYRLDLSRRKIAFKLA